MMIKPGEHFTPEKIINLALRQDIGIDNAASVNPKFLRDEKDITMAEKHQ